MTAPAVAPTPREAASLARRVLDRLRDRERVLEGMGPGRWAPPSVSGGDAGLALAFHALALEGEEGEEDAEHVAHTYLAHATRDVDWQGWPLGLTSGLSGLLLTLHELSRGGTRYHNAVRAVENVVFDRARAELRASPRDGGVPSLRYDVVSGLTGVARVVLARGHSEALALFGELVDRLAHWALHDGFYTPADRVPAWEAERDPTAAGGSLNLGLAHGIAGPLALFAVAARQRPELGERLLPAAAALVRQLREAAQDTPWGPDVPYRARTSVEQTSPSRAAWCYGNPGVAVAVHRAGEVFGRPEWCAWGAELVASVLRRPEAEWQLNDVSLCHGTAGLLLLLREARRWPDAPRELAAVQGALLRRLLAEFDETLPFGYRQWEGHGRWTQAAGVLEGAAGVALALLALGRPGEVTWTPYLLLA